MGGPVNTFTICSLDFLYRSRKRVPYGKVTNLLGLEDTPDEKLAEAIRDNGIALTQRSEDGQQVSVPWQDVLDIVLRERARWQRRQAQ